MKKIFGAILLLVGVAFSATYYIDYVGGSDANNGTAKATPWKLAPGMQGALITDANNNPCRARTHATTAGDTIVFKGGVTWPASALSWDWYFGHTLTVGIDSTWYAGGAWARPIMDNEGTETTASPEGSVAMVRLYGNGHKIRWIEFTGMAQLHGGNNGYGGTMLSIAVGDNSGGEIKNCFFHNWSHGGTATNDNSVILTTASSAAIDTGLYIHDNIWDGSDSDPTPGDMATAYRGRAGHFYKNYIGMVQNGQVSNLMGYVWGNTFYRVGYVTDFDATMHHQCYQGYGDGDTYIYNNLVIDPAAGATFILYPSNNYSIYAFNNIVINDGNQTFQLSNDYMQAGNASKVYIFNNSIQTIPAAGIITGNNNTNKYSDIRAQNNHLIGQGPYVTATNATHDHYLEHTLSTARAAGYDDTTPYALTWPLYPPSNGSTINAGANLSSLGSGFVDASVSTPSTAILSDATAGVSYNATSHTVTYPNRTPILRGMTWDIGAYEYASGVQEKICRIQIVR